MIPWAAKAIKFGYHWNEENIQGLDLWKKFGLKLLL